jgi:ParB family transcriptional regulator, chromosome partitioning protein
MATAPLETGLRAIPLASINLNPNNPRKTHDKAALKELAESIKAHGVIEPVVVRPDPFDDKHKTFELIVGERRVRASKLANLETIPAIVRELADREALEIMVIENDQREDPNPLDQARGYKSWLAMPDEAGNLGTREELAKKTGNSVSWIHARLKLLDLIPAAQQAMDQALLSPAHAVLIARLQPAVQVEAIFVCFNVRFDPKRHNDPGMKLEELDLEDARLISEKSLREWIQENVNLRLKDVPWDLNDATLVPAAGACANCEKRSISNPSLFGDLAIKNEDTCFDRECYQGKRQAFVQLQLKQDRDRIKDQERANKVAGVEPGEKQGEEGLRQLSEKTGYTEPKPDQTVLRQGQWLPAKRGSCPSVEKGIIVKGENAGETRFVCCNASCKVHKHRLSAGSTGSRSAPVDYDAQRYQEHKKHVRAKKKTAARAQLARELVAKVGKQVPTELIRRAIVEMADRRDDGASVLWLMGLDPKAADSADFNKAVGKAKGVQLNQFLVAALMIAFLNEYDDDGKRRAELIQLAKAHGLKNPQGILSHHDDRIQKAKTCRGCGCTEECACEYYDQKKSKHVSCHWIEDDLCSFADCTKYAPAAKQAPAAAEEPAKKAKKAK